MVTDAILNLFSTIIGSLLGALPTITVPGWLSSASGFASTIAGYGSGLGVWIPAGLIMTVAGALLLAWLAGFGVKLARIVASFLTLGGGSAA